MHRRTNHKFINAEIDAITIFPHFSFPLFVFSVFFFIVRSVVHFPTRAKWLWVLQCVAVIGVIIVSWTFSFCSFDFFFAARTLAICVCLLSAVFGAQSLSALPVFALNLENFRLLRHYFFHFFSGWIYRVHVGDMDERFSLARAFIIRFNCTRLLSILTTLANANAHMEYFDVFFLALRGNPFRYRGETK